MESCAPGGEINTEQECRGAAAILGLYPGIGGYGFSYTYTEHQSGCFKLRGGHGKDNYKNQVFYNYANDRPPNSDPNYSAICHKKETTWQMPRKPQDT